MLRKLRLFDQIKYHRQSRRDEKQGTAQSGLNWAPPKGGPRLGARPGGKKLPGNNHGGGFYSMDQAACPFQHPIKLSSPGRGDRPVARSARRILRKLVEASKERAHPADAFCPEAPCPQATTQAFQKSQTLIVPEQSREFTLEKLWGRVRPSCLADHVDGRRFERGGDDLALLEG